jgi:hypothetical protein
MLRTYLLPAVDEMADPETWEGEWVEKRWTPLSRAIDRGLDSIVMLFRDALQAGKHSQAQAQQQGRMPASAATTKNLMPQSQPPINSGLTDAPFMQNGGPSTSSNEGRGRGQQQGGLVLGGVLDSPYDDEGGLDESGVNLRGGNMHQQMLNTAAGVHQRSQQQLQHVASMPPQQQVPLRERAPGGMTRGPSMYGPQAGGPHGQSTPNMNIADLKIRDQQRGGDRGQDRDSRDPRERERDPRDRDRDRERDRDRDPKRRHRSSRDERGRSSSRPRDYYEDDYVEEQAPGGERERGEKHRSSSRHRGRSSSRNHRDRSSSRDPRDSRGTTRILSCTV